MPGKRPASTRTGSNPNTILMLAHDLYYEIKPLLPWRLRYTLRRFSIRRRAASCQNEWPIDERAGGRPTNWPGWPQDKQFALVLTHDVENRVGLSKCRQLMRLESQLGFRSSFNFVPEGDYTASLELRNDLLNGGFEVGVHDLRHDGKLYRSHRQFRAHAKRINTYLSAWQAVGFRAGFMRHNLDWLHELDVQYDASTFDTDPFEPQPDGVHTIFPFWVSSHSNGHGYAELPYTLPQDSTLFVYLRQENIDCWKRKTEWIVERGGMVLVNTHPDYMNFENRPAGLREYPVDYYAAFLEWLRDTYAGQYWHALPRDVGRFCAEERPTMPPPRRKRICMVTASVYEQDNRVTRYAQSLAQRGDSVEVLALAQNEDSPRTEMMDGVRVTRLHCKPSSHGKLRNLWSALRFLGSSAWRLTRDHWRQPYDLVHVHNMPDFLVFSAWLPKLTGAAVILDIHDIFPEFYASKFKVRRRWPVVPLLKWIERGCARFADHVIVSNHLWWNTLTSRSVTPEKSSVFINSVDTELFCPHRRSRKDGKFVIVYPGTFNWHQGLDIAIKAFSLVKDTIPGAELHLYGRGSTKGALIELAKDLKLNGQVRFCDMVPLQQVPELLANADLGVVPKRASDFFGDEAFSTKIMEYMSQGVPVIVARTRIDTYYFDDNVVRFFESENVEDLAKALREVALNSDLRQRLAQNGRDFVARNGWDTKKQQYLDLVDRLAEAKKEAVCRV